jgi:hypothetical protein
MEGRAISPEEGRMILEDLARRLPIPVAPNETHYSSSCPFCKNKAQNDNSQTPSSIVEGELPLIQEEKWTYCQSNSKHLVLIQREKPMS